MKDPEMLAVFLKKGRTERERNAIGSRVKEILVKKGLIPASIATGNLGRRTRPLIIRERAKEAEEQRRLESVIPTNGQQGAVAPPPRPNPLPVASPTTRAAVVPSPAPAPASSGPVDGARYASLFPNDMVSGMINSNRGSQTFARGGIVSLMRGR